MRRFLKPNVIEQADTLLKIIQIDVTESSNHCESKSVDLGFVADNKLKTLLQSKSVTQIQVLDFRITCRKCLQAVVNHILEKTPLKYRLVRNLSCLDPCKMARTQLSVNRFKRVMGCMCAANRVREADVDEIVDEFTNFVQSFGTRPTCVNFKMREDHLETWYYENMNRNTKVWEVVKVLLLLSHGQAAVERGFSVNKNVSVHSLTEQHLIDLRVIKDHLNSIGGLKEVQVTKEMLFSCSSARQKYHADLAKKQEQKKNEQLKRKRYFFYMEELDNLKKQHKAGTQDRDTKLKDAEKKYLSIMSFT
jgi:hypothetical protein